MSGGHFVHSSYPYYRVFEFADELEAELANNDRDVDGFTRGYSAAVVERLRQVVADARRVAGEMKAADYLYSGDTGEESFLREVGAPPLMITAQRLTLPTTLDERSRLRMLLRLAAASLHWGFVGGEWSAAMPDEVTLGAAKEHDEAVWVMELIRKELAEGEAKAEAEPTPEGRLAAALVAEVAPVSLEDQARAFLASLPAKEEAPTYRPGGSLACDHPRIALVQAQAGIQTARADVDDLSRALATSAVALAADFEETLRRLQDVEGELTLLRAKAIGDAEAVAEADLHIRHFGWPLEKAAFRRGAEAMRHALLQRVDWHGSTADRIRAEPVPEDEP